jgi:hypothetical protein
VIANAVCAWRTPRRSRLVRAGECLLVLATLYLAWFIVAFGLIGFDVRF